MTLVPMVISTEGRSERAMDIFSMLLKERIVFLNGEVRDDMANLICAQLLYLESQDANKDIYLYINSPGGSVSAGMAIYDTMQYIKPAVSTVCMGLAASMGAFLLSSGEKGKRICLPNARVMIHQPLGGARGQATEIEISYKEIMKLKESLTRTLAENSGQPYDKVYNDCERDYWLNAQEAVEYGLVDKVMAKRPTAE